MKKLLAVDGNSIINRAFYGIRMLNAPDGTPTNAIYGMLNILHRQIEDLHPDYLAVAFDLRAPTFRHKMYAEYKAGRKPMPDDLAKQLPIAKEVCAAMGAVIVEMEGFEADDILGTFARIAEDNDIEGYILTGDRDSLQLISADGRENVKVLLAGNQETTLFDTEKFKEKYSVLPSQFIDVKALMGDSSDNIPGVPGIGEKTAVKLIYDYSSLDGVYEALPEAKLSPSVKTKLLDGKESAYISKALATIVRDVPISDNLSDYAFDGVFGDKLFSYFKRLGFNTLIKKFGLTETPSSIDNSNKKESLPSIITAASTDDVKSDDGILSVSFTDNQIYLFNKKEIISWQGDIKALFDFIKNNQIKIICHNCKQIYEKLNSFSVSFRDCFFDTMLAAYVLNSASKSFSLDSLVSEYLSESIEEERYHSYYISKLYEKTYEAIKEQKNERLLFDIEIPLAAVLCEMELLGFRIDKDGLSGYGDKLSEIEESLTSRIYFSAGERFNINSPKQLGEILFTKLGLPAGKKTKTGYSTNADILEKLRPYHPIIEDILYYRQVAKLKSTYVEGLLKVADDNGRIHSSFNQTGTVTGRLSSSEPNLQNIPIRTELGRELRKFFVPKSSDYVLIDADYSQIELRLLAAISGDEAMTSAFRSGEDIHTSTAMAVFGVTRDEVTADLRKRAKAVNFGIVYGIGDFSLSQDLGITKKQAKQYIDSYLAGYPLVDKYLKDIIKTAYDNGYVSTLFGRRRYIPELQGQNKMLKSFGERVAMNSPIQGSAADIIKVAMVNVNKALQKSGIDAHLILQVHDELILEAHKDCADKAADILQRCMENAVQINVPLVAEATVGDTWFDNK